jgi:uroporphyrinogen III methyltransferase / synthase
LAKVEQSLKGKRVVVTRAPEQAAEFVTQLERLGADVLFLPMIRFAEVEDAAPLDRAVSELDKFEWVIFTSRNAVKFVANRFLALQILPERANRLMLTPHVAVIGSATSEEALSVGFIPRYEAVESRGEVLALELLEQVRGKRVFLPRSDRADTTLPRALREAGAEVVEVVAYRTIAPPSFDVKVLEAIRGGRVDVITLFSPSAYQQLAEEIGVETLRQQSVKIAIASIGPTTSGAIRRDGLEVAIEAASASAEALCEAILAYFQGRTDRETITQ